MNDTVSKMFLKDKMAFFIKSFVSVYCVCLLIYLPFLLHFIWGNHDWWWIKYGTPLWSGVFEGRFSQFFLQHLLFEGNILPVFTLLAAFAFFSLSSMMLFYLWEVPWKIWMYVLLGIFVVSAPYTLSWLYFAFITLSCLSWGCVILWGYALLVKRPLTYSKFILALCLFFLTLGGYPPIINFIGVVFFSLMLNDLCLNKLTVKSVIRKYIPCVLVIICSGLLLMLTQYFLKQYNLQQLTYNTVEMKFADIPGKILFCAKHMVYQFFVTTSFIGAFYKYCGLCLFLWAVCELWKGLHKQILDIGLFLVFLAGLLFSCVLTVFLAQNMEHVLYEPRVEFFGLMYVYAFSITVLLKSRSRLIVNVCFFLMVLLSAYNVKAIAEAAKIWNLGFRAEMQFAERFLQKMEASPNFNPSRKYTFIQGGTSDFRSRYYKRKFEFKKDGYTLTAPFIPWHLPSKAYQFYYPVNFVEDDFDVYWSYIDPRKVPLSSGLSNYLLNQAYPWPAQQALYVDPELIVLILNYDGKMRGNFWIRQLGFNGY